MSHPIRFGILGASAIASRALIYPARHDPDVVVQAVAARDPLRARAYATEHGIPDALDGYEAFVRHPQIDAVYIALPAALHEDWVIAAVENGKHVLCETPSALNADQARWMTTIAGRRERVVMEAVHFMHHPLFKAVLDATDSTPGGPGRLGRLARIEATLNAPVHPGPEAFRSDPDLGGGALLDLGAHCLHWCRLIARAEPQVQEATQRRSPPGVDESTRARLFFPDGPEAEIHCAMDAPFHAELRVQGERGRLTVVDPLQSTGSQSLVLEVDGEREEMTFSSDSTYAPSFAPSSKPCAERRPGPPRTKRWRRCRRSTPSERSLDVRPWPARSFGVSRGSPLRC